MLKPGTELVAEAGRFVAQATTHQQAQNYSAALEKYTVASSLLKSELERLALEARVQTLRVDPDQKAFLERYLEQLEAQKAALGDAVAKQQEEEHKRRQAEDAERRKKQREQQLQAQEQTKKTAEAAAFMSSASIPSHKPDEASSVNNKKTTTGDDDEKGKGGSKPLGNSNDDGKKPSSHHAAQPSAAALGGGGGLGKVPKKLFAGLDNLTGGGSASASSGGLVGLGGSSGYAARASDIVYKAIEHATRLAQAGQYKTASDVVQHAYDVGSREDHRPKNLERLPVLAKDLRAKFQQRFPPRIPQDNPRTADEEDVLRRSGQTTRLLLFEWDSVEEGYAAENIWMPGRSDQPFQDGFIPIMAPSQMKHEPRYFRFQDVAAAYDKFRNGWKTEDEAATNSSAAAATAADSSPSAEEGAQPKDATKEKDEAGEQKQQESEAATTTAGGSEQKQQQQQQTPLGILLGVPDPMSIRQTVVSDCSLVCSLIVTANYERRFPGARLIRSAIFPQDDSGEPIVNPKGKYCVKMLINGTTRVISIDDRFPAIHCTPPTPTQTRIGEPTLLCSHTTNHGEMWVSLMEKAFIKVSGGSYDFPGSNSSNDLYRLSGWLPDVLRFPNKGQQYGIVGGGGGGEDGDSSASKEKPFDADLQWRRLSTSHARGAVVLTIATPSELPKIVEEKLKLIPGHAYAVLDFKVAQGFRLVKVKNPWSSQSWEGLFGIEDTRRCTPEMLTELNHTKDESEQGVFWMTWNDIIKFFAVAHLSWNPYSLYPPSPGSGQKYFKPTRLARHAHNASTTSGFGEAPQFQILVAPPSSTQQRSRRMHLVLSRHVTDDSEYMENELIAPPSPPAAINNNNRSGPQQQQRTTPPPFVAVHIYDTTNLPSLGALSRAESQGISLFDDGGGNAASASAATVIRSAAHRGGRRLRSSFEVSLCPCLHRGVYSNSAASTTSFDCPPAARELVVVVARLPPNSGSAAKEDVPSAHHPFSFSLTVYSHLPYSATSPAASMVSLSSMLAIGESSSSLKHRCVVPGEWVSGHSCGGPPGQQTFTYNPQFVFSLSQESHITAQLLSPIDACAVNLIICKLRDEVTSYSNEISDGCPWAMRADVLNSTVHPLVLCAPVAGKYCSAVDSSLADCVAIGNKARAPPITNAAAAAAVGASKSGDGGGGAAAVAGDTPQQQQQRHFQSLMLDVRVTGPMGANVIFSSSLVALPALAHAVASMPVGGWLVPLLLSKGVLCSETASKCVCGGAQLEWGAQLPHSQATTAGATLTLVVIPATEGFPRTNEIAAIERDVTSLARSAIELISNVKNTSGGSSSSSANENGMAVLNQAMEKQVLALDECPGITTTEIKMTRATIVRAAQQVHSLLDFIQRSPAPSLPAPAGAGNKPAAAASPPSAGKDKENPLRSTLTVPSGRYVMIAACQEKGTPGPFSISVECEEEQVEIRTLPQEGNNWRAFQNIMGAWSGPSAAGPPHGGDWTSYKKNPTVQLTVPGSCKNGPRLFCRLLALPAAASSATTPSRTPAAQLMMFKGKVSADTVVASSGKFSTEGVALRQSISSQSPSLQQQQGSGGGDDGSSSIAFGVPLEPNAQYFVVMSTFDGAKDSGWKFALKMYVAHDLSGQIVAKLLD